jgi:hypothetical protein
MVLAGLITLAGCHQQPAAQTAAAASTGKAEAAAAPAAPPAPPTPVPGVARRVSLKNDLFEFDYAYPSAAAAIPALKARLDAQLAHEKAELAAQARDAKAEATKASYPFNPYSRDFDWKVVTDLPGWLSLSSIAGEYTGGAHPNYSYVGLLWDKAAGKERAALDLFTTKAALSAAIRAPFCDRLDAERAKKRGAPVNRQSGDEFDKCIDPVEETVILGSSDHVHFDRVGVLVPPYEAGPYAEGGYEVTVPVTPAVVAAVRPEYRAQFAASR